VTNSENKESTNYEDIWVRKKGAQIKIIKYIFNNFIEKRFLILGYLTPADVSVGFHATCFENH